MCNVLPDGNTSAYGIQLADNLSKELADSEYKLQVVDRSLLQSFLAKYRIPAQSIKGSVTDLIEEDLGPKFLIFGTVEKFENGLGRLTIQMMDVRSKDRDGYKLDVNLGPLKAGENLEPIDPFPSLPPIVYTANGEIVHRSGVRGITPPRCTQMPNPPYSDEARKLKYNGSVTVEAVVNPQGEFENMRVVYGLIAGLNETTLATMKAWRCNPALKDNKPIPLLVRFTVEFRLY